MSAQTPQQCKNVDTSNWMYNDQHQTPCQVLSSSLRLFDTAFNLTWLDLSFSCPHGSNHTNTTTYLSRQLSDYCCSSVSFSLFSSCWACQWDQPVQGYVRTTWGNYSSTCSSNSTITAQTQTLAATQIGTLSSAVQSALTAANIRIPKWAFLPVTSNSTWDESAAKSNATFLVSSSTAADPNQLSPGAIAGISIGSFILFCALLFIFTVMCMRKKQRHRLEAFRHRSASIFGHKKRVVNMREKTVGAREQQETARMDLALEGDGLASPVSVKGGLTGAQRVNSDLTMDISHDTMFPALLGGQTRRMETPGSGVGGVPRRERPESGSGVAARFQSNVRRSLARLGRVSQPGRTEPPQSHGLQRTTSNRHTHPMTQMSPPDGNSPFAVPFFSSDQIQSANTSGRPPLQSSHSAPPSAWPTGTFDTTAAHPLTQQQRHPQLSRNLSGPSSALQLSTTSKVTPMPLTKEALSLARVAQDGTLFVLGEPELRRGSGNARGSGGAVESRPAAHSQQHMVHTVSIERNPAQMQRHADLVPRRSDSLRRSQMQSEMQGQGQQQMGLVLHEAIMDGSVPRRKTPSRQRQLEDRGEGPSTSRTSPAVELGRGTAVASSSQPTASQRQPPSSMGAITAPIARKSVPKSDSSVLANAGSAMGSNGELSYAGEEDESIAALEIRNITGSATGTSGSTNGSSSGNGNGNGRGGGGGGRGTGKKRGRESRDLRLSIAANTSLSSGNMGGVKSDGTRTPSPKVAPSAEWFDLFRRGTVPILGGGKWPELGGTSPGLGAGEGKADLSRTKTAPAPLPDGAGVSMPNAPDPSKAATLGPLSSNQKRQAFQPNASAGPSMSTSERNRTQSASNANPAAGLYRTPIAALYSSASSSSLSALASASNAPSGSNTSTVRKQSSAQNTSEPASAPALTIPATKSGSTAAVQPAIIRALPQVSPSSAPHHNPTQNLQSISFAPTSTPHSFQPASNLSQVTTTASHSQVQSQRQPHVAPLPPIPPSMPVALNTLPQPRVAPAGARPPRRLPAIPPQSPPPG